MAERMIGRSEPLITAPGTVNRMGSATDRQRRRDNDQKSPDRDAQSERREEDPVGKHRRRLFDMLFYEIDRTPDIGERQKKRLKNNLRAHITRQATVNVFAEPPPSVDDIQSLLNASTDPEDYPELQVEEEAIVDAAVPDKADTAAEVADNLRLAEQFRACLAINTDTARRVALYLKLLVRLSGAMTPHYTVDV